MMIPAEVLASINALIISVISDISMIYVSISLFTAISYDLFWLQPYFSAFQFIVTIIGYSA
jgi:hypothetical protein